MDFNATYGMIVLVHELSRSSMHPPTYQLQLHDGTSIPPIMNQFVTKEYSLSYKTNICTSESRSLDFCDSIVLMSKSFLDINSEETIGIIM